MLVFFMRRKSTKRLENLNFFSSMLHRYKENIPKKLMKIRTKNLFKNYICNISSCGDNNYCYVRTITIFKTHMLTQTQQQRQWNAFFRFCYFAFNADFYTKYLQFLIDKGFPKLFNKMQQQVFSMRLCYLLLAGHCLSSYEFLYVKYLSFYESISFQLRSFTCHIRLFLSLESNSLSATAINV